MAVDELVAEFVLECREDLDGFEQDVVGLERDPGSRALLDSAFRALHTTKGTGAYFGFHRLESVAHLGESVLAACATARPPSSPDVAAALLGRHRRGPLPAVGIERDGTEPALDTAGLEARLRECLTRPAPVRRAPAAFRRDPGGRRCGHPRRHRLGGRPAGRRRLAADRRDPARGRPGRQTQIESVLGPAGPAAGTRARCASTSRRWTGWSSSSASWPGPGTGRAALPGDAADRLDEVTRSLQTTVLRTRVEPVERAWSSLPRLVRDLSETTGKRVRLLTEGQGTPVDRALLAAVKAPLTHLLRNAVDHGVERPQDRRASGKPVEATLTVRARAEQDEVVLEVEDDGAGIDVAAVARTAVAQGVVSAAEVAAMGTDEVLALVLRSGLSTARDRDHRVRPRLRARRGAHRRRAGRRTGRDRQPAGARLPGPAAPAARPRR